jgi:hypothetical protein
MANISISYDGRLNMGALKGVVSRYDPYCDIIAQQDARTATLDVETSDLESLATELAGEGFLVSGIDD